MLKFLTSIVAFLVLAGAIGGCASDTLPVVPTHAPFALPTLIPPTPIPFTPTTAATPTVPPVPATLTVTIRGATPQSSPVVIPSTASPARAASPTPAIPSGVFVTDLRTEPAPVRGPELRFFATFLNGMNKDQNYRWKVFIFRADTQKSFGETARTDSTISIGTVERQSIGTWKLPLGGSCEFFYAQVGWFDADNKIIWFTTPSSAVFQKALTLCPP